MGEFSISHRPRNSYVIGYASGEDLSREKSDSDLMDDAHNRLMRAPLGTQEHADALEAYKREREFYLGSKTRPIPPKEGPIEHIKEGSELWVRVAELIEEGATQGTVIQTVWKHEVVTRIALVECFREIVRRNGCGEPGRRGRAFNGKWKAAKGQ